MLREISSTPLSAMWAGCVRGARGLAWSGLPVLASVGPLHRPQTDADTRNLAQPATTNTRPQHSVTETFPIITITRKVGFAKMTNAGPCLQPPSSPTFCSGLSPLMRPPMLTVLPRKSKTPTAPPPPPTKSPPPPTRSPPTPRPPLLRPTEPPPPPPSTPMARPPPRPCPPTQRRPTLLPATNHHLSSVPCRPHLGQAPDPPGPRA